jgi:hypothetical protein
MNTTWLSLFAAIVLTPVVMRVLARRFPAPPGEATEYESLRRQYGWLETTSQLAALAGIVGSIALLISLHVGNTPWIIGVGFGWLVLAPVLLIAAFTLPRGLACWRDFWRFYELTYRISLRLLAPIYVALCALAIVSTLALLSRQ